MILHLMKLVWNRKRSVAFTVTEVFLSFFAVFATALFGLHLLELYHLPLGFTPDNVWVVNIGRNASGLWTDDEQQTSREVLRETCSFNQVESAALASGSAYGNSNLYTTFAADGIEVKPHLWQVTESYDEVMGLDLIDGRWFEPGDEAAHYRPVVINDKLAWERFAGDAVGKIIGISRGGTEIRVIGVVSAFRHHGELSQPPIVTIGLDLVDQTFTTMTTLVVKVKPGTGIDFEETLSKHLQSVAAGWSFELHTMAAMRERYMTRTCQPLFIGALVAGFLLLMVGLGLVGVLWQSVVQRIREIGLRRAKGASRRRIHRQIVGEVFVFTSIGIGAAILVVVQLGLFDLLAEFSTRVSIGAVLVTLVLLYSLTTVCAIYPSRMATRVEPAQALHDD
jgi:putative ABC transport system permease protein